ncbi:MAG: glycosyl hydrolase family 18 protein [Flavobacteriales bacterium]
MKHSRIMGITTSFLIFFSVALKAEFKVVGYLYNWGNFVNNANNVDYTKVTHINIAFINPDDNGNLSPTSNLSTVVTLIHSHNVKVLASFGGAGSPSTWATLMASDQRDAFIVKIVKLINDYNLDGIDMDLEGSAIDGNYNDFVLALKAAVPSGKLLTAAVATSTGWDIYDDTLDAFDFINVMSYDFCGTWSTPCQHSSYKNATDDMYYWKTTRKQAEEKVILGLPSYGYSWESGSNNLFTYKTIVNSYARATTQDSIHTTSGGIIYHNSINTIKQKTQYALDNAGGVMWWALPYDYPTSDSRSLLRAMGEVLPNSIKDIQGLEEVRLYPNPSSETFTLSFAASERGTATVELFDISGKKTAALYNGEVSAGTFSQSFNINFLAPGIYTCRIITNKKAAVLKLVKE